MAEVIVLDPAAVATGRTQFDISPYAKAEGIDWGDAEITAYLADRERGSAPVDFRIPNRQITIPMNIKTVGAVSFVTARQNLQRKVARIQQEGGWLGRTTPAGTLYIDIVNATLHFGGDWMQASRNVDVNAELRLEAIPDWYGAEIVLPDRVETTQAGDLIWTETNILGDYPGRLRLVVDEDDGFSQMGLIYGIRSRHYSSATTAALRYFGSQLTPLSPATSSGGAVIQNSVSTGWTPVASTDIAGASLTHTGTYRVWARGSVVSTNASVRFRLVWDVGDFALPTENEPVAGPPSGNVYPLDLGEVRLDRVPAGPHRWRGVIQAAGAAGGEAVTIDRLYLVPVDEGYGVLRGRSSMDAGLTGYSARDEFNQTAGVLVGKTMPAGGAWFGAGDADDWVVNSTTKTAQRSAVSDSGPRHEIAGSAVSTNIAVKALIQHSAAGGATGVIARYVDFNNFLLLQLLSLSGTAPPTICQVWSVIGGVPTTLADVSISRSLVGAYVSVILTADTSGRWAAYVGPDGSEALVGYGQRSELATGGTLDDGRVALYDRYTVSVPMTRTVDSFAAWVPQQDAVLFANQSAELRTEGMFREDATGTAFGPVTKVVGDLPRIPPSGTEGRPVQFFLKGSRGDFETLPDTGVDTVSAQVSYRPSYLLTS